MTLTVRLDRTLESALERYCAEQGVTKTLVAQEALAAYLVGQRAGATPLPASASGPAVSHNYAAFARAGVLGAIELAPAGPARSADKAAVRARLAARAVGPAPVAAPESSSTPT